jgi:hypothetical protein
VQNVRHNLELRDADVSSRNLMEHALQGLHHHARHVTNHI